MSTNSRKKCFVKNITEGVNITEKQARSQGDHVEKDIYEMSVGLFCLKILLKYCWFTIFSLKILKIEV